MTRGGVVEAGIDRRWLEDQARHDPIGHAYALWDLDHETTRVEFRVHRSGGVPTAYLLIWRGAPDRPIVHWVGDPGATPLLDALPPRPMVAVVPPTLGLEVERRRGPVDRFPVRILARDASRPLPAPACPVRPLGAADAAALRRFGMEEPHEIARGYRDFDPARLSIDEPTVWGAFDGDRLVGVARAAVRLPAVWIVSGVLVAEGRRGRGIGAAVTAAVARVAETTGARTALYVRADNVPAVRLYHRLGFEDVAERTWIDAGGGQRP